eukprot:UN02283
MFQAIILVLDSTDKSLFDQTLKLWGKTFENENLKSSVIVGNHPTDKSTKVSNIASDKLMDLQAEFVLLKYNQKRVESNSMLDESEGVDRIEKALQCVMWPDLTRNKPPVQGNKPKINIKRFQIRILGP